jgi:hypothetical protein
VERVFDVPKNFVAPENFLDPLNGRLTEIFLATGVGGGEVAEINLFNKQFFWDWSGTIRKSRAHFFPPP